MDLNEYERIKSTHFKHWAERLKVGDICLATIRHQTDGTKNLHDVEVVVDENLKGENKINCYFGDVKATVKYNDLKQI